METVLGDFRVSGLHSREMERKFWRNNRLGGKIMNCDFDMISLKCLRQLKTSRKPLELRWSLGCRAHEGTLAGR